MKKSLDGGSGNEKIYCRRLERQVDSSQAQMVYVTKFRKCKICLKCV